MAENGRRHTCTQLNTEYLLSSRYRKISVASDSILALNISLTVSIFKNFQWLVFSSHTHTSSSFSMQTHLKTEWRTSLNLLPRSLSPLAVTHSWLRKCFASEARKKRKKKSASRSHLKRREVDLNEVTCQTDRSAPCRQQGSLLSLTRWTEAGRETGQCWDLAPCYGSSAGTQSCV